MSERSRVLILDFGGQYNLLIARRVRERGVYCEIKPYNTTMEESVSLPLRASSSPAALPPSMKRERPNAIPPFLRWACPFWAFATASS